MANTKTNTKPAGTGSGPVATGGTASVPVPITAPTAFQPSSSAVLDMPNRVLQITLTRKEEILLSRLQARAVEKGLRPSETTKSRILAHALDALAAMEGVTADPSVD